MAHSKTEKSDHFWSDFANATSKGTSNPKPLIEELCCLMLKVFNRNEQGKCLKKLKHAIVWTI